MLYKRRRRQLPSSPAAIRWNTIIQHQQAFSAAGTILFIGLLRIPSTNASEETASSMITNETYNNLSNSQQAALAWCPRIAGAFSLIGAALILFDIIPRKERRERVYCQIVCGMAICDFLSAIPWIVGSAAVPEFAMNEEGMTIATGAYGASGNEGTCKLQGMCRNCCYLAYR